MFSRFWCVLGVGQILFAALVLQVTAAHGTYFTAGGDADHIAVAIDSRITEQSKNGLKAFDDRHCKIFPLSDRVIFFFHGVNSLTATDGHTIFDAGQIAQQVYNGSPEESLRDLASQWSSMMIDDYKANSARLVIDNKLIIEGFFAGSDPNGTFGIYGESISGTPVDPSARPLNYEITGHNRLDMASSPDILQEFATGGTTDWAKSALLLLDLETRGKGPTASLALRYETMVTIAGQSGNPHIGGETAVMTMDRTNPIWRWFHRPAYCPQR